jgi:hypothetical protein
MKKSENIVYKQIQSIHENDTRTYEQRHATLPFVRDEDLPEWEAWWDRTMTRLAPKNVTNN